MGDPRRLKRKFRKPKQPWEKERIIFENELKKEYGLKNKKEIWKTSEAMRRYRHRARDLVGERSAQRKVREENLINNLVKKGILKTGSTIDNILSMNIRDILERRLQTLVWKKGLALTINQARQFITHGHITVNGKRVSSPGMIVDTEGEKTINWHRKPIETLKKGTVVEKENVEKALGTEAETKSAQPELEAEEKPKKKRAKKEKVGA